MYNWILKYKDSKIIELNLFLKFFTKNSVLISFFFIWIFEWLFIFEYCLYYNTYHYIIFPYRLPLFLIICFIFFIYVWGISVWRRTQYGRFTRGDRKLWFKGYSSFWIVEIITLLGIFGCSCWMNWGPRPLFPRKFYIPKKGLLIELSYFTYLVWMLYLLKFSVKWCNWKFQLKIVYLILFITFCLIWRDILIIIGRENIVLKNGARWKYLTTSIIIYSFVPQWWIQHFIDQKNIYNINCLFNNLNQILNELKLMNIPLTIFKNQNFDSYQIKNFLPINFFYEWNNSNINYLFWTKLNNNYLFIDMINYKNIKNNISTIDSSIIYPRRYGYQTKRIAIWTLLLFLKLWHHIMLFIWWFIYLLKLINRKKTTFTWLSICNFNIYCCFLICLVICLFGYLRSLELIFRVTKSIPIMRSVFKYFERFYNCILYVVYLSTAFIQNYIYNNNFIDLINISHKIIIKGIKLQISLLNFVEKNDENFILNNLYYL